MSSPEEKEICIGDNSGNNHRNWCSDLPMDALAQPILIGSSTLSPKKAMSSPEEKDIRVGDNSGSNHRNWCSDLPMDALLLIMNKVGAINILMYTQWVCKNWRKVCREVPSLRRKIDLTSLNRDDIDLNRMAREAINRAQGNVQQFDIRHFGDDELLRHLADSTSLLRSLRLISAYGITEDGLVESVRRFPLLEELDITFGSYGDQVFELVGKACPRLKCFRHNWLGYESDDESYYETDSEVIGIANASDNEALGIANHMPNLRQLQIVGHSLSNAGLMAILDRCLHLESLDIRRCCKINMDATLRSECARIKDLRLPDDPLDDYEFWVEAEMDYNPDDDDFDQADIDMMYEDFEHSDIDMCDNYYNYSDSDEGQFGSFM